MESRSSFKTPKTRREADDNHRNLGARMADGNRRTGDSGSGFMTRKGGDNMGCVSVVRTLTLLPTLLFITSCKPQASNVANVGNTANVRTNREQQELIWRLRLENAHLKVELAKADLAAMNVNLMNVAELAEKHRAGRSEIEVAKLDIQIAAMKLEIARSDASATEFEVDAQRNPLRKLP
jgi:hypothetical protein